MIQEDYVSFEIAKLLKEKGFDEYCWKFYELGDCGIPVLLNGFDLNEESNFWNNKYLELYKKEHCHINDICSAPTLQMAMKWLRRIYNVNIDIASVWNQKRFEYQVFVVTPENAKHCYVDDKL